MPLRIVQMYKIHCLNVAQGTSQAPGYNNTFYATYEQALEAARAYAGCSTGNNEMVIYKAHVLVRKTHPPIEVMTIEHDGEIVPLR